MSRARRVSRLQRVSRLHRATITVALVLGVASTAACSSGGGRPAARPSPVTTTSTVPNAVTGKDGMTSTGPTAESQPPSTPEDVALAAVVVEDPPLDGFRRADARFGTGALDLDTAANAESDVQAERALLETRHFERGASRAWVDDNDDVVYVAVYAFASANDAAAYLRDGTETLIARGARGFVVPDIPGAVGFTTVDDSNSGAFTTYNVAFTSGPTWVLVIVGSRGSGRSADDARAVADSQYARVG